MTTRGIGMGFFAAIACIAWWALALPKVLAADISRDWKTFPAVVVTDQPKEFFALGDVHGDYDKLVALLIGAKIINAAPQAPEKAQWAARKSLLVCTGDLIDKGPKSVEVIQFMRALQTSAQNAGGRVIITLGNHEAEFLATGGENKKAVDFEQELASMKISPQAVASGTDPDGIGAWLRSRPIAAKVGDWFFCHAGNTGGSTVAKLESDIEAGVNKDGFGTFVLAQPNSILEARTAPVAWWMIGLADDDVKKPSEKGEKYKDKDKEHEEQVSPGAARLMEYAHALGCKYLVMGHQPGTIHFGGGIIRKETEPFAYAGVLFLMDTGMSRGVYDGNAVVLRIKTGPKARVETIDSTGATTSLWAESQTTQ